MTRHELSIYQDIDAAEGVGPQTVRNFLSAAGGQPVTIRLNSQGGNVIDGLAIYNLLRQYTGKVTVAVDGMALSIASIVAMGGDEIQIAENAWMMVHCPHLDASGQADDLRQMASLLDGMETQLAGIYSDRTRKPVAEVLAMMDAETWLTGPQAVQAGFADTLTGALAIAAHATIDVRRFRNAPRQSKAPATFQTHVELAMARGLTRSQATRAVVIERPDLQQAYVAAANGRQPVAAKAAKATAAKGRPWPEVVKALARLNGWTLARAAREVDELEPELRQQYVQTANGR